MARELMRGVLGHPGRREEEGPSRAGGELGEDARRCGGRARTPGEPECAQGGFTLNVGGATAQGMRRKNDDAFRIGHEQRFFAVSDGIGGAPDGEIVSRVACGKSLEEYESSRDLVAAFRAGNDAATYVSRLIDSPDSGATLLVAACDGELMRFAWVGDSLAYRLRDGVLERLTEVGRIGEGAMLDAAIGYGFGLDPRVASCDVRPGDRLILCTDGVWEPYEVLGLDRMAERLADGANAPCIAGAIVDEAVRNGTDNATAVVIVVLPTASPADAPAPSGSAPFASEGEHAEGVAS